MNINELREKYLAIATRSLASSLSEFNAAVARFQPKTPEEFVAAARKVSFRCETCLGTGEYITYIENKIPKGPGGPCFRCQGKGNQNDNDRRRNWGYDQRNPTGRR